MAGKYAGYNGDRQVSTENQEILTIIDPSLTFPRGIYHEFSFLNNEACTVKINNSSPIPLDADQGVQINRDDTKLYSFIIVESGINYKWFGKY
jgi:hypothetical protein